MTETLGLNSVSHDNSIADQRWKERLPTDRVTALMDSHGK